MIKKISHVAIAVKNLEEAISTFSKLTGIENYHIETVEEQKVRVAIFKVGESRIELTEPTSPDSPVAKFIEKRGEGIHHIAFEVDDIEKELERVKEKNFQLVDSTPRYGANNCLIAFIHPKSVNGVLVELTQEMSENKDENKRT
ncbi:MAG: methylmalonyl-CoA epimerase [Candidatus Kryptonium sp.]|nr:methylmalonyl-CoA epimerase [Candidatus Kryptonium sp.]MDW8109923.1 methylmalonyl-CoA epimerase [Candidatus Kryptonium sp.]